MSQDQALTEIERLGGDEEFQKVYLNQHGLEPGVHKEAVARMTRLFSVAHPTEPPAIVPSLQFDEQPGQQPDQQQQQQQQPDVGDEMTDDEAEYAQAEKVLTGQYGESWADEIPLIRDAVVEIGGDRGDELMAAINDRIGNDPAAIAELIELRRENEKYPLLASIAELAQAGVTPEGARLLLERAKASSSFVDRFTNASAPGHLEAMAYMRSLYLAANPPAWWRRSVEVET